VGDTLLHVLDRTNEVPGSAFSRLVESSSSVHIFLNFLRPFVLINGSARACIGAQELGRHVEGVIESAGVHVRVFFEVFAHLERHLIVVVLAEVGYSSVIQSPDCEDGDGNDEGEDEEEESEAGVGARACALSAVDHEATK